MYMYPPSFYFLLLLPTSMAINSRGKCNTRILKLGEVISPAGVGHGDEKSMVESDANANTRQLNAKESKTNTTTRWTGDESHKSINTTHQRNKQPLTESENIKYHTKFDKGRASAQLETNLCLFILYTNPHAKEYDKTLVLLCILLRTPLSISAGLLVTRVGCLLIWE